MLVLSIHILLSTVPSSPSPPSLPVSLVTPSYRALRTTGNSTLWEATLPAPGYSLGAPLVISVGGSRHEMGRAYSVLLGNETIDVYHAFMGHLMPNATTRAVFEAFADWLWERFAAPHIPPSFIKELEGMRSASPAGRSPSVDVVSVRFNVLGNLPADTQNIATMLEQELEKGLPPAVAEMINKVIAHLLDCSWCEYGRESARRTRQPFASGCDAFAVWGSRTVTGRLFSSRNLDWNRDTGLALHKLVVVYRPEDAPPYATFGFATGFGALAGMSAAGLSVSEMNLDNSLTTFDGPPFPLRLRMVLERSSSLADARSLWENTNNTDSMNFLIASATERKALAVEAIGGAFSTAAPHATFSGFFGDDDPTEAAASCTVGTTGGGTCGTGFVDVPAEGGIKKIGMPLPEAVWRTNHAVHPRVMPTQEPLFNYTTFRYSLLRQLFETHAATKTRIGEVEGVRIAASLGIKGPDFFSCDPRQFSDGSNIMSILYAPRGNGTDDSYALVAWEDGTGTGWSPAACNAYVRIDLASFWR